MRNCARNLFEIIPSSGLTWKALGKLCIVAGDTTRTLYRGCFEITESCTIRSRVHSCLGQRARVHIARILFLSFARGNFFFFVTCAFSNRLIPLLVNWTTSNRIGRVVNCIGEETLLKYYIKIYRNFFTLHFYYLCFAIES